MDHPLPPLPIHRMGHGMPHLVPEPSVAGFQVEPLVVRRYQLDDRWKASDAADPFHRLYVLHQGEAWWSDAAGACHGGPGTALLVPALTRHSYRCRAVELTVVHFHATRSGHDAFPPGLHQRSWDLGDAPLRDLYHASQASGPAAGLRARSALLTALTPFADLLALATDPLREPFRDVLAIIEAETPGQPVPMPALAAMMGLGANQFTRRFRAAFGQTPVRYRRSRRVARAQHLLRDPTRTMDQIARACGFSDAFHLNKVFRQDLGMTPSEFRRRATAW